MLTNSELLASPIVANNLMNRGRGLSGPNSYEKDLQHPLIALLEERIRTHGSAVWFDACCGEGRALQEAAAYFETLGLGDKIEIVGMDLVASHEQIEKPGVRVLAGDVSTFSLNRPADLITCVHGLHYLGDKLGFLEHAYAQLAEKGLLLANFDAGNIRGMGSEAEIWPDLARRIRQNGVKLKAQRHLIRLERTSAPLHFGMSYQGATVSAQPNYTGITVMDSWYAC